MDEDSYSDLPEDDRDLRLARRMGERLDAQRPPEAALDPGDPQEARLGRALHAFRAHAADTGPDAGTSARLWSNVEEHLSAGRPDRAPTRRLRLVRPAWVYAAAAVVVLAAFGWFLFLRTPSPVLVATAGSTRVTYTAPDGSEVTLRPHTSLYTLDAEAGTMRYRVEGEAFFAVVRDPSRTFVVEANAARVRVLGTRFDVSTWGERTSVYLEEGRVRFEHVPTGQAVVLAPGQRSVVTAAGELLPPEAEPAAEHLDWLRGELSFDGRPLRLLLAELSQHYDVAFDVPPALLDETLTGTLRLDAAATTLADLGTVLGGTFREDAAGTYRFEPE